MNAPAQDWISRAKALTPLLDAAAPRIEAAKALPADVIDALHEAKLFRMLLPRALGGAELPLEEFFQVVIAVAEGDASTAWSVSQSAGCAMSAAYLSEAAARDIFGDARAVLSWGFPSAPCRAAPVEGGWKVNGTWGFGSGNRHSTWVGGHCQILDAAGKVILGSDGQPVERTMLMPRAKVTIKPDSWNVVGLRGTGSDTYSVADFFVPAAHAIVPRASGRDLPPSADAKPEAEPERRETGTLYRFSPTTVYQSGFAGVALGIARATQNAFLKLATQKTPSSGASLLRDNPVVQLRVAQSEARLGSARAWVLQILREMWAECAASGKVSFEHRIQLRLAATYAIQEAREVVETAYIDAGATAIFESNPFERRLRDMHAVSQQIQSHPAHFQSVGQHYLGLKPSTRFI